MKLSMRIRVNALFQLKNYHSAGYTLRYALIFLVAHPQSLQIVRFWIQPVILAVLHSNKIGTLVAFRLAMGASSELRTNNRCRK